MIMENLEKSAKQQICFKLCANLATFLPVILVLVLFSFSFFFSISESFPFLLAILIALLSTMFLVTLTKKKGSLDENLVQDKLQKEESQITLGDVIQIVPVVTQQSENAPGHEQQAKAQSDASFLSEPELKPSLGDVTIEVTQQSDNSKRHEKQAEAQPDSSFPSGAESSNGSIMDKCFELNAQKHEQQAEAQSDSSFPSESESTTSSIMAESLEIDHNINQNLGISGRLVSNNNDNDDEEEEEEDSLIEIKLPSSHFSALSEEPKQQLESKVPEFLPESIFNHQGLMELLAEINEMNDDENLIEIDISMGSSKCQDLRFKQELEYYGDQCVLSD